MNFVELQRTTTIEQILRNAIEFAPNKERTSSEFKQIEKALTSEKKYIPTPVLLAAHRLSGGQGYLHEILAGCDLLVPGYVEPERNPELQARVERLQAEQNEREYRAMTKNVNFNVHPASTDSFLPEMRSVQGQLITVGNVFLTIIAAFVFGYKAIEYSSGQANFTLKVSFGLLCALIVAIADVYFLLKRFNKIE